MGVSLDKNVPIEPLGEARWTRVERSLMNALADLEPEVQGAPSSSLGGWQSSWRSVWRGATPLVLTGALAAAVGAFAWRGLVQPEGTMAPARIATAAIGSRVEVGESTVEVGPQSAVRLSGDDTHGISVLLDTGRVECDVAPRHGRPPFLVEAGAVEVRVIGTHFVVTRAGEAVTVAVQRGRVEVISGQGHAFVDAGSQWPLVAPAQAAPAPGPVAQAIGTEPAPAPDPIARPPVAEARAASGSSATSAGPGTAMAASPRMSSRERYDAASKLEAQKPEAAMAIYGELARQGGAWGMNALFAEGRLEADRGRQSEATHLLEEYLARYPFGPNAEDARRLLARMR
ncbi:MAG TPA: FecR domain-containing protein [Polyangiaceae bacterium]|jgi:hypothetical protein|nr:FecR domain-containing protein [Polyangiaceae bacterium]